MDTKTNVAPPASDTEATVEALNAKWRNYICQAMNLDPDSFQLAQGGLGLQTSDNYGLFRMADAVPASSAVGFYDAGTTNSRAAAYSALLNALLTESGSSAFRTALGNYYSAWYAWSQANLPAKGDTMESRVQQWGMVQSIEPGVITNAVAAIQQAANTPLARARARMWTNAANYQQQFNPPGQPATSLFIYTATTDNAQNAINQGASLTLDFDSSTSSSDVSSTFAEGSASGFYSIFSADVSGSFDKLDSKAASASMQISGRIGKFATLSVGPGEWYDSSEVNRAFKAPNDNTVWDPSSRSGTYDSFFGQPDGALARYVTQLVLVSDYEITVTSTATYSQEDYQQIKTHAEGGIWPFFSASADATHTTDIKLDSNNHLVTTVTLNKGLIQIWGVSVQNQA